MRNSHADKHSSNVGGGRKRGKKRLERAMVTPECCCSSTVLFLFLSHFLPLLLRVLTYMMRPSRRELISEGVFWMLMTVLYSSNKNSVT